MNTPNPDKHLTSSNGEYAADHTHIALTPDKQLADELADSIDTILGMNIGDELLFDHNYDKAQAELLALITKEAARLATAVIGEDEILEPEKEWYSKTKLHGGTHEEYHRLKAIINNNNNLRAQQRQRLLRMTEGESNAKQ